MNYYKEHAKEFIEDTFDCDMSKQYFLFEKYLCGSGTILDIGFGSGRDSLYFKSKGYNVYSIDPEESFVEHAINIGLDNVFRMNAEEINFEGMFDGIWACASLLHVHAKDLEETFIRCSKALKENGMMYASFKYGDFEGERNGRYFIDLNEERMNSYLSKINLVLLETLITEDVRPDRHDKWLNVILKKN